MDDLISFIRAENDLLDRQMEEKQEQWKAFWYGLTSYVSVVKIGHRPIISPVVS